VLTVLCSVLYTVLSGSLKKMPDFSDIEMGLLDKEGVLPNKRRFNLFR
jgi:hypothetical protein